MSVQYKGLEFNTRLTAHWAVFFDLAGWEWWTNPAAVGDWRPDFMVRFNCGHSECPNTHTLLIAVLPLPSADAFKGHPCLTHSYGVDDAGGHWIADAGAAFGINPSASQWEMSHGSGGGLFDVPFWISNADDLWKQAAALLDRTEGPNLN